jgi:hypothetical protein
VHPRDARYRWQMRLHKAELAGREMARLGLGEHCHPYRDKPLRGFAAALYKAWLRGHREATREMRHERER